MTDTLYQDAILKLARAAMRSGRLAKPDTSATVDNPLCGDRVTVDLVPRDGRAAEFAQKVRGCVLCEAAGSVLGQHAVGASPQALRAAAGAARAIVAGAPPAAGSWPELAWFAPVHAHKSRHNCVLLPFRAVEEALQKLGL